MTSGDAVRRRISSTCCARPRLQIRGRIRPSPTARSTPAVRPAPPRDLVWPVESWVVVVLRGWGAFGAWRSLLRARATLMRQLESELERDAGGALADFDVLAQRAGGAGKLRMRGLAARALISRSGRTRRVARLV